MIVFENVYKEYKNATVALNNVNFTIPKGDFVFLVGKSGAGKSTLLKLLIREENTTKGSIYIDEMDITKIPTSRIPRLRRNISMVFQDFRLLPKKTVFENVAYTLEVVGAKRSDIKRKVERSLELVSLTGKEKSYPFQLSGGESQRVAIARAIVNDAPILLCDEPTGNLDISTAWEIMSVLENINKHGRTVVVATHAIDIVNSMKKHVIAIEDGKLVSNLESGGYFGKA